MHIPTQKTCIAVSIASVLGAGMSLPAAAATYEFSWEGVFTMLDSTGFRIWNFSIPAPDVRRPGNQIYTPITGTLSYDTVTASGSMTMSPFEWGSGSLPFDAQSIDLVDIDGPGGDTLALGNMLLNWNGTTGMPVSIVWDIAGLQTAIDAGLNNGDVVSGVGAEPASDGIYAGTQPGLTGTGTGPGGFPGYLALGPTPIATTTWNTSLAPGCTLGVDSNFTNNLGGGCLGVDPSGGLPLLVDTVVSAGDYTPGQQGIGGSPMPDGPLIGSNINFDVTSLTVTSVPVPAAVWLFGSGLLGLMGVARRRRTGANLAGR